MPEHSYTYTHSRPILAADSVVFTMREDALHVLLVRRGHDPYEGRWAIPGGFVNENEPLEEAGARELREETGLTSVPLTQIRAFGDPGRDPRGWAVSIVFLAVIDCRAQTIRAGDDAREAQWFPIASLPALAFDHDRIVEYAVKRLSADAQTVAGQSDFIPATFNAVQRQCLVDALADLAQK